MTSGEFAILSVVFGAFVGIFAARYRGFNPLAGFVGGMFLGPLSPLMFFMSGILSSKESMPRCPHCAEKIRKEARVCKHCGRNVAPKAASAA